MSLSLSPTFVIGQIRIGSISEASSVSFGNSWPIDFTSNKKQNQGFGEIEGDGNRVDGVRAAVSDPDVLDMLAMESEDIPEWLRNLLSATMQQAAKESRAESEAETEGPQDRQSAPEGTPVDAEWGTPRDGHGINEPDWIIERGGSDDERL